jgi:hypothetical protein
VDFEFLEIPLIVAQGFTNAWGEMKNAPVKIFRQERFEYDRFTPQSQALQRRAK